ncbi:MAG: ribosome small subunit-dependent GTPase A [Planctomycetota bacterium]|nr:ribosome small subunit-dependent GTPase A [Planctomycetota bacterium]MCX8039551.1 ribosome small subunit-dependent GTPase A [Planctomycetota bacterium]MDW8373364.1 ribosome small subunit-dependent GTPase A [Planctomycetota bacterium]
MPAGDKDKGTARYGRQRGLGRLRRANLKEGARSGGWERLPEDAEAFERLGDRERRTHAGERLLARFNRLVALGQFAEREGEAAEVCEVRPGRVVVRFADGREEPAAIRRALEKRISGVRNTLAVGDRVRVVREAQDLAIVGIEPRRNQLARSDAHNRALEHVLAANVDRLVVCAAVREPEFKPGFVDRALLMAAAHDVPALLVVTKRDLGDAAPWVELYRGLGYPCLAVDARCAEDPGVRALAALLAGAACVFAGQSGVGKSSLVNACFPGANARIGAVAEEGFGRHTTTAARSYVLPGGGRLIDTPGIRECVIRGLLPLDVALLFPDLARWQPLCRYRDCTHRQEPGCAVQAALARGEIAPTRYASYRSIIDEDLAEHAS